MIIGLTGPKLAGKGSAAQYFAQHHQTQIFSMSSILSDVATRLHLPHSRANMIAIATGFRTQLGNDILAKVLAEDIRRSQGLCIVIDGIRFIEEVRQFQKLSEFILLYIDAPLRVRFERAHGRGEKVGESTMSFEDFEREEQAVTERGIAALVSIAQIRIVNDASMVAFEHTIEGIFQKLQNA